MKDKEVKSTSQRDLTKNVAPVCFWDRGIASSIGMQGPGPAEIGAYVD